MRIILCQSVCCLCPYHFFYSSRAASGAVSFRNAHVHPLWKLKINTAHAHTSGHEAIFWACPYHILHSSRAALGAVNLLTCHMRLRNAHTCPSDKIITLLRMRILLHMSLCWAGAYHNDNLCISCAVPSYGVMSSPFLHKTIFISESYLGDLMLYVAIYIFFN